MKRIITLIITLVAIAAGASAQNGSFAWYGANGKAKVNTGLGNSTHTEGLWYVFDDSGDGGESKVVWDVETADGKPDDNLVKQCGGISGTAVLDKGYIGYNPFVDICFDVAGLDVAGDPQPADASAWEGITIAYTCDVAPIIQLGLGDVDLALGYATPQVALSASPNEVTVKRIPWSAFKQPDWYKEPTKINGYEAAQQLCTVRFKVFAPKGSYHFNIVAIGDYNMQDPAEVNQGQGGQGGEGGEGGQGGGQIDDNRTKVSTVKAECTDIWFIPKFEGELTKPTLNVITGAKAYFYIDDTHGWWQKKVEGTWQDVEEGEFSAGTWRFKCQLRVDDTTDPSHQFVMDKKVNVTVNTIKWGKGAYYACDDYSYIEVYSNEFEVEDPNEPIVERTEIALVEGTSDLSTVLPEVGAAVEPPVFSTTSEEPVVFCFDTDGIWQKKVNGVWTDVEDGEFTAGTWRFRCQVWVDDEAYVLSKDVTVNVDGTEWERTSVIVTEGYSCTYIFSPEIELEDEGGEPIPAEKCDMPTIIVENGKLKFECEMEGVTFVSEVTAVDAKKSYTDEISFTGIYRVSVYAKKDGFQDSDVVEQEVKLSVVTGDVNGDGVVDISDYVGVANIILTGKP